MSNSHPHIPVLDLAGTPEQIGAAHGEEQRERIAACIDRFLGYLCSSSALALNEQTLWSKWAPQVSFNERVAADLVEEMRGIARGANLPFSRVFLMNSMLDVISMRYTKLAQNFGCTTFATRRPQGQGGTLIGQTYDMPHLLQDFLLLTRIKPTQGPRQLVFTFTGIVGACGFNEAGIGLCINYLSPLDVGIGRLHSIVVRQILAAPSLAAALEPQTVPPRAGGAHYLVADREGNLVSIETTGKRFEAFHPDGPAIGHTNHYLGQSLKEVEYIRERSIGSSLARYTAQRRYFQEHGRELDLATLQQLTRNHTSYPTSICAHGMQCDPPGSCTLAAMVHSLEEQTTYITHGCACENQYHPVGLGGD